MGFESEDHIRVRAYHLWEANGRPEGRDLEFWVQARQTDYEDWPTARKRLAAQPSTAVAAPAKGTKGSRRSARKRAG